MRLASRFRLARRVPFLVTALSTIMATALVSQVWAHKINVFAWVEADTVFVEGYYSRSKKANNALVEVFNEAGQKLLEGRTNAKGEFSFQIPEKTDLRVVLSDGAGHKDDFIVYASSPGGTGSSPSSEPAQELSRSVAESVSVSADLHQLETIIDGALDRKLDPVIKLIRDSRKEGPGVTEIVGGIGYIFGLFGVFMYFKSRKERK